MSTRLTLICVILPTTQPSAYSFAKAWTKPTFALSFQGITTPMGVATYDNARAKEIAAHLPTAEELQTQISIAEKEYKRG